MLSCFHNPARITARLHWKKDAVHDDAKDRLWQLPRHRETGELIRACQYLGDAICPQRLADARHHEQQRHTRIADDVPQAVDAVVSAPIGQDQGLGVFDVDEARWIAAGGG
jgi:hypothetical protein